LLNLTRLPIGQRVELGSASHRIHRRQVGGTLNVANLSQSPWRRTSILLAVLSELIGKR
jgi:hypothetical protein